MWSPHKPVWKQWDIDAHRQHMWGRREGWTNPVVGVCEVTPLGWILYDTWSRKTESLDRYFVALIEDGRLIETYRITFEEWSEFPTMPSGWWIPF